MDTDKEPCPYRILEDTGAAFTVGLIGGGVLKYIQGFRNAPKGLRRRLAGGMANMRVEAPKLGGSFAAWGGTFSVVDCMMIHCRGKEDPWNAIVSGAVSGGVLAARNGVPSMVGNAIISGLILAMFEGYKILITRFNAETYQNEEANANLGSKYKQGYSQSN